jgi:hypothetical protein
MFVENLRQGVVLKQVDEEEVWEGVDVVECGAID